MAHLLLADGGAGSYVNWGFIHVSVTNLVIIGLMVLTFALALALPFPHGGARRGVRR